MTRYQPQVSNLLDPRIPRFSLELWKKMYRLVIGDHVAFRLLRKGILNSTLRPSFDVYESAKGHRTYSFGWVSLANLFNWLLALTPQHTSPRPPRIYCRGRTH